MSHDSTTGIAPVIKERTVPLSVEQAFARFTEGIATWWPLATHSVAAYSEGRTEAESVLMEGRVGGRIIERQRGGVECEWGRITDWEPPSRVAFTWYPGRDDRTAMQVEVTFAAEGDGARLRLVHTGWEIMGDEAAAVRSDYDGGWEGVLDRYGEVG